ncbi:DUF1206 domain-containing protein [Amnibacterium endophyticum]|uniref:DUF1206 domain-containing protein n=1 Tax=Amnibacterium endophyticum TaxID=2109337 RepID=UPI003671B8CE
MPWLRVVARSGYIASGLLRLLIGVLALLLAAGLDDAPEVNAASAFGLLRAAPAGGVLVAIAAGANGALALWLVVQGVLYRPPALLERWRQRIVYWSRSAVYVVIGLIALRVAIGARQSSVDADRAAGRRLLEVPGGSVVLLLLGLTVLSIGVGMVWVAIVRRFVGTIHLPEAPWARRAVVVLGIVGYAVQGVTIAVVGGFLAVAAVTSDAARTGGLNDALVAVAGSGLGRGFLVVVAVGWAVAGAYALLRARLARLD